MKSLLNAQQLYELNRSQEKKGDLACELPLSEEARPLNIVLK